MSLGRWVIVSEPDPRKIGKEGLAMDNTSVMIIIAGESLSDQHTDLLICHCRICHAQGDIKVSWGTVVRHM